MKKEELIHEELTFEQALPISNLENIHTAIINVMEEVKNIDKSMTVGEGKNSYKGVSDKDVKYVIGRAMSKNLLTCVPINIDAKTKVYRWETTDYNGKPTSKQSVFVEAMVTYKLTYAKTGESITIVGYGHGVDSQDKAAGKATTYALKNALLYSFLVPTGSIDDTDKTHSDSLPTPSFTKPKMPQERFEAGLMKIEQGKLTVEVFKKAIEGYELSEVQTKVLSLL